MSIRVYRYDLLSPTENEAKVEEQIALGRELRNLLTTIERARRAEIRRVIGMSRGVQDAELALSQAVKSDRMKRYKELANARLKALVHTRCEGGHWSAPEGAAWWPLYEKERIDWIEQSLSKSAYNHYGEKGLAWGTRLRLFEAARAARQPKAKKLRVQYWIFDPGPLYDETGLSPADPRYQRMDGAGACVVQIQKGISVAELFDGRDTRASVARGIDSRPHSKRISQRNGKRDALLRLRVGSVGKKPIWAAWPIRTLSREIPHLNRDGKACRVTWLAATRDALGKWSCEITVDGVDIRADFLHSIPKPKGALAIELTWSESQGGLVLVGIGKDTEGQTLSFHVPSLSVVQLRKAADLQSIRDLMLSDQEDLSGNVIAPGLRTRLAQALVETTNPSTALPQWLERARRTIAHWKSQGGFHALVQMWRREKWDGSRAAYEILQEWEMADGHLLEYQRGVRRRALVSRKQEYRTRAWALATQYDCVIIDDRNLSREARWGDNGDLRFIAAPAELRQAFEDAFGWRCVSWPHVEKECKDEDGDAIEFCTRALDAYRNGKIRCEPPTPQEKKIGAWAKRKTKKAAGRAEP